MKSRLNPTQTAIVGGAILLIAALVAVLQLLTANGMRTALRQLYSPSRVQILTLKTAGRDESCGWYQADGEASRWRYVNSGQGLWAEGRSTRLASDDPAKLIEPDARWRQCMQTHVRGALFDRMTSPLIVAYLNAT